MSRPSVLVTAARGIGDIVRVTPLVRACAAMGCDVDLLIAPDYPGTAALVRGAAEVRDLFTLPSLWNGAGATDVAGLREREYDVAIHGVWTATGLPMIRSRRSIAFDRSRWLARGDGACVEAAARDLGWTGPLPKPFCITSGRRFGLPPGTVALHPGCKPDWPWKKWHGFDDLARRLPRVVIVGTPSDADNRGTYFLRDFIWPPHARSYVGSLDLADTAALIGESAALVSNDSGLMHVGAALGVPTFGIFGITSPAREAIDVPNMIPVHKGLSCEAECRRGPWGRRDCDRHLECLRTLTPDDVLIAMAKLERLGAP